MIISNCMLESNKTVPVGQKLPDLSNMPLAEVFERYNLLGYDNGDGELACCMVHYDANNKKLYTTDLSFNLYSEVSHVPNILSFNNNQQAELVSDHFPGEIYHTFKRCPGIKSSQFYLDDMGKTSCYTYEELMGHSFACALLKLSECNSRVFDITKPTIIMVGCPSSQKWKESQQDYEKILSSKLDTYFKKEHGEITILVLAESSAAMAGAIEMDQKQWLNFVTQILDLGSSTFDITTVTPEGIPREGEASYQFGGNQLDCVIANYGDHLFEKQYPRDSGYAMADDPEKKTRLRFKKELCYGDNGCNQKTGKRVDPYSYYVKEKDETGEYQLKINEDTEDYEMYSFYVSQANMSSILTNKRNLDTLSCEIENLDDPFLRPILCHGWLQGCKYVMEEFYNSTRHLYEKYESIPRRLILTGGVSNMPEVQELAKESFEVQEVIIANKPSLTVSRGLARILGNEIIKKSILAELEEELFSRDNGLPDAGFLLNEMIAQACKADLDEYEKAIKHWAEGSAPSSLNECVHAIGAEFDGSGDFVGRACEAWFQKYQIAEKIEAILRRKFQKLFPKFHAHFDPVIQMPDMRGIPPKPLENEFAMNLYMFFDEENCPPDPYDWDQKLEKRERQKILEVFRSHRSGLATGTDTIQYRNNCSIRIDKQQKTKRIVFEERTAVVKCIDSVYRRQLTTQEDAAPIQKKILEMLKPQILGFVEGLTYYLAMERDDSLVDAVQCGRGSKCEHKF